jgi:hypothetical protein
MQWGSSGFLDMLEYEEMRSPTGTRGGARFWGFLDPSRPWESLGEKYKNGLVAGCLTSTGLDGEALATLEDRPES